MNEFLDIFMEAGVDTLKLIPFLFLTYILMEWLEHRTGSHTQAAILRAGKAGPVFGGILGIVPQCGFSAAASNLYSGGLITAGALVAVFLSTSDEMLPIFISEAVPAWTIIKILAVKMVMGILFGFLLDFLYHSIWGRKMRYRNIHTMCESEHCKCDDEGIFFSALRHTIHITIFLFLPESRNVDNLSIEYARGFCKSAEKRYFCNVVLTIVRLIRTPPHDIYRQNRPTRT